MWSQILQMRTHLADLTDSYPDLGNRLSFIWGNLDAEDSSLPFEQRMKYANEFEQLLTQIREKPGFSRFLLPREFSDLQRAAQIGPIVILNASQYRCDAFVILPSSLHIVPLHLCDMQHLRDSQANFRNAALGLKYRQEQLDRAFGPAPSVPTRDEIFKHTLRFLWSRVAEPCLAMLEQFPELVSDRFLSISILLILYSLAM